MNGIATELDEVFILTAVLTSGANDSAVAKAGAIFNPLTGGTEPGLPGRH